MLGNVNFESKKQTNREDVLKTMISGQSSNALLCSK